MRTRSMLTMSVLLLLASVTSARAQGAELRVLEPMQGAVIRGNAITVIFEAEGRSIVPSSVPLNEAGKLPDANRPDEGHLHLMLDLQPVVVWEKTESYTFQNVLPGQHQLMIEIVNKTIRRSRRRSSHNSKFRCLPLAWHRPRRQAWTSSACPRPRLAHRWTALARAGS